MGQQVYTQSSISGHVIVVPVLAIAYRLIQSSILSRQKHVKADGMHVFQTQNWSHQVNQTLKHQLVSELYTVTCIGTSLLAIAIYTCTEYR